MYAIAEFYGTQVKLVQGDTIRVPKLSLNIGDNVTLDKFLLTVATDGTVKVGKPYTAGSANATVVEHDRDDKIMLLHKKRRKGYVKQGGHKQPFTMIKIDALSF